MVILFLLFRVIRTKLPLYICLLYSSKHLLGLPQGDLRAFLKELLRFLSQSLERCSLGKPQSPPYPQGNFWASPRRVHNGIPQGDLKTLPMGTLELPQGEFITTFLGETSKPSLGKSWASPWKGYNDVPQGDFKALASPGEFLGFPEENLNQHSLRRPQSLPQGTLGLPRERLEQHSPRRHQSLGLPRGTLGLSWGEFKLTFPKDTSKPSLSNSWASPGRGQSDVPQGHLKALASPIELLGFLGENLD